MLNHPVQFFTVLILFAFSFSSCKKSEITPDPPALSITINPALVTLQNEFSYLGKRLTANIENAQPDESLEIVWSSENPRIASVKEDGTVWPEAAGETYILATLVSGKGVAKCKVVVTDANDYKFRLVLRDKGTSSLSIANPTAFLSAKAIARRQKQNIAIDESDLPISPAYLKAIQDIGGTIVAKSKWLNTVSVNCTDEFLIDKYKALPFVKDVLLVWEGGRTVTSTPAKYVDAPQAVANHSSTTHFDYGSASTNITVNNGKVLHELGFKGAGIDIAVIDAGFINLKNNAAFKNVNIKGAKSFVYENDDPYAVDTHGIWVTSTMAVNIPRTYVGTAPEANYWLLRTEDQSSEYPIEEDYWVNAAEYADSVGVDIINSSLYYTDAYYFVNARYKFEDMDGKTAFATRGANVAADKGILIVNCAGNDRTWVGTPADAPNVLTVGSVNSRLNIDAFTSWGVTVDGRMKPDILAMGGGANVINTSGIAENRSGTSYASPIMCGLAACLWQAYPTLTNKQLLEIIRKSGDRAATPEVPYGNGIADMQKAMNLAKAMTR
ncbi:S8 family serine peptidase [Pedobacter sp. MC2016-14]|uniref:S8 family serine peptidase n=1 Tax=Pedobacter sp. MC2016-14 TaxID=2897327 RepID=UPI001E3F5208|nr:S8 family serine peptidase [Pedobacter sp. MC2016-14]MCD0489890.1 S8 family serine peptidase [Pedobacter sp. MC2016-14]